MRRLFEILASGCGLIVLSPLFLVLAIWIKLDSKGPVFYRQVRVGRGNKDFRIFKFRSMRIGADKGSLVTIGGRDPRITRSGYYIRKYKFDELPQLIYKIPCSGVISRPAASTSCRSFFITSAGIHLRSTLTVRTRLRLRTMSIGA